MSLFHLQTTKHLPPKLREKASRDCESVNENCFGSHGKESTLLSKIDTFLVGKNSPAPSSPIDNNVKCQTPPRLHSQEINSIAVITLVGFFLKG